MEINLQTTSRIKKMSDKKLNAIREIEFRIRESRILCQEIISGEEQDSCGNADMIDTLLFDINDFINDLKNPDEAN